jgi:hypothetical protein
MNQTAGATDAILDREELVGQLLQVQAHAARLEEQLQSVRAIEITDDLPPAYEGQAAENSGRTADGSVDRFERL